MMIIDHHHQLTSSQSWKNCCSSRASLSFSNWSSARFRFLSRLQCRIHVS